MSLLTDYAINLDEELVHRLAGVWSCPANSRLVETNAGEHDVGGVGNIDAKDVDQFRNWLPQRL